MTEQPSYEPESLRIAAVDLGSNSFHMMIAEEFQGEIRTLEKRGEKVQLAAGLDNQNYLSEDAIQRGVDCLAQFGQRLQGMNPDRVVVFATNALRAARNRRAFIDRAEDVLGYPVEVIAGREEARLIYLGVAHTQADDGGQRLVVDIGGGSTEFIIGERFEAKALESLHMGCVSYTKRYFPDGKITAKQFRQAVSAAKQELLNIKAHYRHLGWQSEIGSSGTIRAVEQAIVSNGWGTDGITPEALKNVVDHCLLYDTVDDVDIEGVKPDRRQVFVGGLAILVAVFETLDLKHMRYSDGALREGALWDLVGRSGHEDVRTRTIASMQERFYVDTAQAERVEQTALALFQQIRGDIHARAELAQWLRWAARVHEIGLSIAHSGFHKHGAYLLQHSDMLGFTRQGQMLLAILVRNHRRKIHPEELELLPTRQQGIALWLIRILRLATVLNHSREAYDVPLPEVSIAQDTLYLALPEGWLDNFPLTAQDLEEEADLQKSAGLKVEFR
ncbi:MAG: exopolyphosphatase [Pseudomonadota bacterium]|nr:exopolyphosphatase [Pseudomonadota bacterium]